MLAFLRKTIRSYADEIKNAQNQERRENAIMHQEMLKNFLEEEKANRKDDRPL